MQVSENCLKIIKEFEGFSHKSYYATDHEKKMGICTIGYGTTVLENKVIPIGKKITEKEAENYLKKDVDDIYLKLHSYIKVDINQNQLDAIVSLVYNIGINAFKKSTLLKKLNNKDFEGAAEQFERWVYQDGKILKGLVERRKKEKEIFSLGA